METSTPEEFETNHETPNMKLEVNQGEEDDLHDVELKSDQTKQFEADKLLDSSSEVGHNQVKSNIKKPKRRHMRRSRGYMFTDPPRRRS